MRNCFFLFLSSSSSIWWEVSAENFINIFERNKISKLDWYIFLLNFSDIVYVGQKIFILNCSIFHRNHRVKNKSVTYNMMTMKFFNKWRRTSTIRFQLHYFSNFFCVCPENCRISCSLIFLRLMFPRLRYLFVPYTKPVYLFSFRSL